MTAPTITLPRGYVATFPAGSPQDFRGQNVGFPFNDPSVPGLLVVHNGTVTVAPLAGSVWDVSDRAIRALGQVSAAAGALWDVSDRVGRLLGVVDTELPAAIAAADLMANPTAPHVLADLMVWDGSNSVWNRAATANDTDPVGASALVKVLKSVALTYLWNPVPGNVSYSRLRTANVFKTVAPTAAGNTALWTPTAGTKFRLMGGLITCSRLTAAAVGDEVIGFQDAAVAMNVGTVTHPLMAAVAQGTPLAYPFNLQGNGYLSAAANNVLNVNLGTAITAGRIQVSVWGTEE